MAHPLYLWKLANRRYATSNYLWLIPCISGSWQTEDMPPVITHDDPFYRGKLVIRSYSIHTNLWLIPSISVCWKSKDISPVTIYEFSRVYLKGGNLKMFHQWPLTIDVHLTYFQHTENPTVNYHIPQRSDHNHRWVLISLSIRSLSGYGPNG